MPFTPQVAAAVALYVALLFLPGMAVVRALGLHAADPLARAGTAVGVGMALLPIGVLWARAAGVPVGRAAWWAVLVVGAAVTAAGAIRDRRAAHRTPASAAGEPVPPSDDRAPVPASADRAPVPAPADRAPAVAMAVILVIVLAARWYAARDLVAPLWGDSVQHAAVVRLFDLHGGLPGSWEPLFPLTTFTYHFGLHAGVAGLVALTGLAAHEALLVAGQVLMVLQCLTAYALAARLTGRRWAGVGAALAAAGLSPMPGHYLNWGRYTQLAGQVMLPVVALLLVQAVGRVRAPGPDASAGPPAGRRGAILLAAVACAGLALTHYLVALFLVLFAAAHVATVAARDASRRGARPGADPDPAPPPTADRLPLVLARMALVAGGAAVLVLPWLLRLRGTAMARAARALATTRIAAPDAYGVVTPTYVWGQVDDLVGIALVVAFVAAGLYGLRRRDAATALGLAWTALLVVAAYPQALGVPVTGPLKDFTVAIGLYVPAGLVIGGGLGALADRSFGSRERSWVLAAAAICVAAAAAWLRRDPVVPTSVLVAPADRDAIAWVADHTPPDARFLVTCAPAYGSTVCAGEDAGWWLPVMAERRTTVPPINYGLESGPDPGYRDRVNELAAAWRADLDAPATRAALREAGVTHAFVGTRPGLLDRTRLDASPHWRKVYDAGGAAVYEGPLAP